jgi:hypothetical protein
MFKGVEGSKKFAMNLLKYLENSKDFPSEGIIISKSKIVEVLKTEKTIQRMEKDIKKFDEL